MKSEKQLMLNGELYDSTDAELTSMRLNAREICFELNHLEPSLLEKQLSAITQRLFKSEAKVYITPPFQCDYGENIQLGNNVFFNFNCVILDVAKVTIGNDVLFGPGVQILTALHPLNASERRKGLEYAKPITIGDDVWVGGGEIICPGVSIGAGCVIGAGSVVTKSIPENMLAVGNPCKVVREVD